MGFIQPRHNLMAMAAYFHSKQPIADCFMANETEVNLGCMVNLFEDNTKKGKWSVTI